MIPYLISGHLIWKYKPPTKYLLLWNIIIGGFIVISGRISYAFIGCEKSNPLSSNGTFRSCNTDCYCDSISYAPVCNRVTNETYFSPCHAGCKEFDAKENLYTNCSCSTNKNENSESFTRQPKSDQIIAETGSCESDCNFAFYAYIWIDLVVSFLAMPGSIGYTLLEFR